MTTALSTVKIQLKFALRVERKALRIRNVNEFTVKGGGLLFMNSFHIHILICIRIIHYISDLYYIQ